MPTAPPIDLSELSASEFDEKLGGLVRAAMLRDGVCILIAKGTKELTFLRPRILDEVSDATMAEELLRSWSDEEILEFLEQRERRRTPNPEGRHEG